MSVKHTNIGSDNGLSPGWCQAIIWINDGIMLIGPLGMNFSEISIEIYTFSFRKTHFKMLSGKWRPFCLGLNMLTNTRAYDAIKQIVSEWLWPCHTVKKITRVQFCIYWCEIKKVWLKVSCYCCPFQLPSPNVCRTEQESRLIVPFHKSQCALQYLDLTSKIQNTSKPMLYGHATDRHGQWANAWLVSACQPRQCSAIYQMKWLSDWSHT